MQITPFGRLVRSYYHRLLRLYGNVPELWPTLATDPDFIIQARKIASAMVHEVAKSNGQAWRKAALKPISVPPEIERIAERNARLIQSIPLEVAQRITARASRLQQIGGRSILIEKQLKALAPRLLRSKIQLIARTEISRAETDLTRARAEKIGIDWYQWQTSEDSRVRPSHRNMNQVLVAWEEPPSPERLLREKSTLGEYHAGACPNCRCVSLPLADFDEVKWPAKVFHAGRIQRMTRVAFIRLAGVPVAA